MAKGATLGRISITDLQREIARRGKGLGALERKRAKLLKKVADLDRQIAALGGSVSGRTGTTGPRKRAKNTSTLVDALAETLKGKTMSVTEVADAVQQAGYVSTSPSFRTIVNQALINSPKFKPRRGQYTAK